MKSSLGPKKMDFVVPSSDVQSRRYGRIERIYKKKHEGPFVQGTYTHNVVVVCFYVLINSIFTCDGKIKKL